MVDKWLVSAVQPCEVDDCNASTYVRLRSADPIAVQFEVWLGVQAHQVSIIAGPPASTFYAADGSMMSLAQHRGLARVLASAFRSKYSGAHIAASRTPTGRAGDEGAVGCTCSILCLARNLCYRLAGGIEQVKSSIGPVGIRGPALSIERHATSWQV